MLKKLKKPTTLSFTAEYIKEVSPAADFRDRLNFKHPEIEFPAKPYFQVFEDRNGFMPNLSVVDLLFSQGPQAKNYLQENG